MPVREVRVALVIQEETSSELSAALNGRIFRAYDIRGVVGSDLTAEGVYQIGLALGSEARCRGEQTLIVGRDGRLSGPALSQALQAGLLASGVDVIDIGQVTTPILYFATHHLSARSGVMLTGSHNPSEYNGLKMVLGGETLSSDAIQDLWRRIQGGNFTAGKGQQREQNVVRAYFDYIKSKVTLARPLKVVVDCGNGVAGAIAPVLLRELRCEVVPLYCEVDGRFPNHHPDPSEAKNLTELIDKVKQTGADLGLAFDGDGDRLGVVTDQGNIIWPDRQMMLFAKAILANHPGGEIIFDIKCSQNLARVIEQQGGKATLWKTGHSFIKQKLHETGALLAGEMSGHIFFKERWLGFDDALYAAARLLEIVAKTSESVDAVFAQLPDSVNTPELKLPMPDDEKFIFMERFVREASFEPSAEKITLDGLRVNFEDGWGLLRASNTTPCLVLRFEADNEKALQRIRSVFREQLLTLAPQFATQINAVV